MKMNFRMVAYSPLGESGKMEVYSSLERRSSNLLHSILNLIIRNMYDDANELSIKINSKIGPNEDYYLDSDFASDIESTYHKDGFILAVCFEQNNESIPVIYVRYKD